MKGVRRRVVLGLTLLAATTESCARYRVSVPASLQPAMASYREHRDIASLQILVGSLRLGMPEEAVRGLLGEPDMCPAEGQCYYGSDKLDAQGRPFTLVVEYRYTLYSGDAIDTVVTHRVEEYSLSPVGE